MKLALIACCTLMGSTAGADAAHVDWKLYGTAEHKQYCFYDAKSVLLQSADHLRVWTKCLDEEDIEALAFKATDDRNIVELTEKKIISGYVPPIMKVYNFPFSDQIISVVQYETAANVGYLKPTVTIYWELNCPGKMMRVLQLSIREGVDKTFSAAEWRYVEPDTNGSRLLKLVCQ